MAAPNQKGVGFVIILDDSISADNQAALKSLYHLVMVSKFIVLLFNVKDQESSCSYPG